MRGEEEWDALAGERGAHDLDVDAVVVVLCAEDARGDIAGALQGGARGQPTSQRSAAGGDDDEDGTHLELAAAAVLAGVLCSAALEEVVVRVGARSTLPWRRRGRGRHRGRRRGEARSAVDEAARGGGGWRAAVCVCAVRRGGRCPGWLAGAPCARREEGGSASARWPPPLASPLAREGNAPLRAPRGGCPGPAGLSLDRPSQFPVASRARLALRRTPLARSPPPRPEPSSPSTAHDRHELRQPTSTACRPGCPGSSPPRQDLVRGER